MAIFRRLSGREQFEEVRQRAGTKMVAYDVRFVDEWTKVLPPPQMLVVPKGDPDYQLYKFKFEDQLRLANLPLSVSGMTEEERQRLKESALARRWQPDRTMLIKVLIK